MVSASSDWVSRSSSLEQSNEFDGGDELLPSHFSSAALRYIRSRRRLQPSCRPALRAISGHLARSTWLHPRSAWRSADFATFESTALELLEFSMKKLSIVLG